MAALLSFANIRNNINFDDNSDYGDAADILDDANADINANRDAANAENVVAAGAVNSAENVHNDANATANNAETYNAAEADLERELRILTKPRQVLELKRQKNKLSLATQPQRSGQYVDIEHTLPKFSCDDVSQPVRNFLTNFGDVMDAVNADDSLRFLSLRRSLEGAAKVFLQTTTSLRYDDLVHALLSEFDISVSRHDVYRMLMQRHWNQKEETLHCYILHMQALSRRADISEEEVDGSCFRCWKMGHDHRSCLNPRKILTKPSKEIKQVAGVSAEDDESIGALGTFNLSD
ncbi:uncharacterized protein [Eurosta solidaginis]|uniref:uncharacterized protein n=1 Tax=Eurosta solidaginis TaxID=178769 RepID=UPI0035309241